MRLIDADAAKIKAKNLTGAVHTPQGSFWSLRSVLLLFDSMETADVAPVMHGRWVEVEGWYGETISECSACGADFVMTDGEKPGKSRLSLLPQLRGEDGWERIKTWSRSLLHVS